MISNQNNAKQLIDHTTKMLSTAPHLQELMRYKLHSMCQQIQIASGIPNPSKEFYFDLPKAEVISLYKNLSLNPLKIGRVFCSSTDRYSQILLLLTCAGLLKSDDAISKNAFFLRLAKAWNDAVDKHFPDGIDANIMDKVIEKKLGLKYLLKIHRTPFNLIASHFLPMLLNTYGGPIIADPVHKTNKLFTQANMRLDQVFQNNWVVDFETGDRRYFTGLVPMYEEMEAEIKKKAVA
jgi:hypothetical protein